jgi:two-component system sensor histidine kinase VicK
MILLFEIIAFLLLLACGGLGFWVAYLSRNAELNRKKEEELQARVKLLEDEEARLRLKGAAGPMPTPLPPPKASEEPFSVRDILLHVPDGLVVTDANVRIVFANLTAERIIGLPAAEANGQLFWEVVKLHEEDGKVLGEANCPLAVVLERRTLLVRGSDILTTRYNTEVSLAASLAPVLDLEGKSRGAIYLFRDISEAKQVDRLRDEFVTNVSHELRTPLTVIKGTIETLQDGAMDDHRGRGPLLSSMARETERLIKLVNDLLILTRADAGALNLQMVPVDLGELIRLRCERFDRAANQHQVNLHFMINSPPGQEAISVFADPDRIAQVLDNLLDNAIRYSPPEGEVSVTLDREGDQIACRVTDQGPGIPAEHPPLIFERFYRANQARGRGDGGIGLGLSIAQGLVVAHGGRIAAYSVEGKGTTVAFWLPFGKSDT